jgi:transcriptional regulator with XRE-family HTH domain
MRTLPRSRLADGFSEGARLYWLALESRGLNQKEADALLGVSAGLTNRLLYGERKPGRALADRIREIFGIEPAMWDSAPTEKFVPPGARVIDLDAPIPFTLASKVGS